MKYKKFTYQFHNSFFDNGDLISTSTVIASDQDKAMDILLNTYNVSLSNCILVKEEEIELFTKA